MPENYIHKNIEPKGRIIKWIVVQCKDVETHSGIIEKLSGGDNPSVFVYISSSKWFLAKNLQSFEQPNWLKVMVNAGSLIIIPITKSFCEQIVLR